MTAPSGKETVENHQRLRGNRSSSSVSDNWATVFCDLQNEKVASTSESYIRRVLRTIELLPEKPETLVQVPKKEKKKKKKKIQLSRVGNIDLKSFQRNGGD